MAKDKAALTRVSSQYHYCSVLFEALLITGMHRSQVDYFETLYHIHFPHQSANLITSFLLSPFDNG